MGKKPAAKKKNKGPDLRGFCTSSVASVKKVEEDEDEEETPENGTETNGAETAQIASGEQQAKSDEPTNVKPESDSDEEEWEKEAKRAAEEDRKKATAAQAQASLAANSVEDKAAELEALEDLEKSIERRLEEELLRLDRKVTLADATAQLERRTGAAPAGVVLLNARAEQKVTEALQPLRDSEGRLHMTFPRHWRYKGKLTYERLNGIYLTLEALKFRGDQIRAAMEKTYGHDVRAAMEYLLINLPKEELPRQWGGERKDDDDNVEGEQAPEASAQEDVNDECKKECVDAIEEKNENEVQEQVVEEVEDEGEGDPDAEANVEEESEVDDEDEEREDSEQKMGQDVENCTNSTVRQPNVPKVTEGPREDDLRRKKEEEIELNKKFAAQYCEASDTDSDDLLDPEERLEKERIKDPTARYLKVLQEQDTVIKLCKDLKNKKKHGAFKQNFNSDMQKQKQASDRLRSIKLELEKLEAGKYGKLDPEKIAGKKPPPKPPKEAPKPAKETPKKPVEAVGTGTEVDSELPSLFSDEMNADAMTAPAIELEPCRSYNITSWTGRTPKQAVDEYVRRRIFGKQCPDKPLTYSKVEGSGGTRFRSYVTVLQPRGQPPKRFDPDEPCETHRDAENLAAAFGLWNLSAEADHAGLCRGLPPPFRQRFQDWQQEKAQRLRDAQRSLVKNRVEFVERLLRNKPLSMNAETTGNDIEHAANSYRGEAADDSVNAPNESIDDVVDFVESSREDATRLREMYSHRREEMKKDEEFCKIQNQRAHLPVADQRDSLLRRIAANGVTVVSGATGSGKTTQVPQCILEDALDFGKPDDPLPNIIVTEPRRISAISVAKRVSQEMGDPRGGPGSRNSLVGYQIRLERKVTSSTHLMFCTVGVLLRKMQATADALSHVTHVFVDEVHERSADTDLLLLLLRQIRHTRPELRIIVMSATLETEKLTKYFGSGVPVLSIPGRTFPVESFFLEDAIEMSGYQMDAESEFSKRGWNKDWRRAEKFQVSGQNGKKETLVEYIDNDNEWGFDDEAEGCDVERYNEYTLETLAKMDHTKINFDLIEATLELIESSEQFAHVARHEGAVLIFLPGLAEITKLHERLVRSPIFGNSAKCVVYSLHSVLSGEDHTRAFERPPNDMRKIVLSTNIAETGVTIPDIVFVIDGGKVKSQSYHEPSNTSSLKEQFISRAEIMQRRGRAGRVREGFAFHLVTRRRFDMRLHEMPIPELLRCSLMELMLSVLSSGLQPCCFSEALDPPPKSRIDQAVMTLSATGCVEIGQRPPKVQQWGTPSDDPWYVVTPLGQCLARLPCDVRLGKMVLFTALFGGPESIWTVAATLSHRSPLVQPFVESKRMQAKATHCAELLPKSGPPSDHFALITAYKLWDEARKGRGVETLCRKSWLSNSTFQTIRDIRNDLAESVRGDGFCEKFDKTEVPTQELHSPYVTSALIFAGLYPNVARIDFPKQATEKMPILSSGSEQLRLHPGSLCHGRVEGLHRTNHRWVCYHTKLKTSQVFLRDATFLTPNAMMLFAGEPSSLNIHPIEKSVSFGTGAERHWQVIHIAPRSAALLRQLRIAFDALLRRKAASPKERLSTDDRAIIVAYVAVLNSIETE